MTPDTAGRVEQARAEIRELRKIAKAASRGRWLIDHDEKNNLSVRTDESNDMLTVAWVGYGSQALADAQFIASADPTFVLSVLDAAEKVLDRHRDLDGYCGYCERPWPCPDAAAIIDLFAPPVPAERAS